MKTVSRVMNNEQNVAPQTLLKVREAAKALNYKPNLAARGLASARSFLMALLYDSNPNSAYIMALQTGAMKACRTQGYHLLVESLGLAASGSEHLDPVEAVSYLLDQFNLTGIILTSTLSDNAGIIRLLNQRGVRYVPVAPRAHHGDLEVVRIDDVKAARQMTEYLIKLGHRDIGFIKGPESHSSSAMRFNGYREAMRGAGLHIHADWVWSGDYSFRTSVEVARQSLDGRRRPSAIFASNDDMAAGVMTAANQLGLSVPKDLSVCGFDDTPIAEIIWPQLTTVRQPLYEMGEAAARILMTPIKKLADQPKVKLQHELIIRQSCRAMLAD